MYLVTEIEHTLWHITHLIREDFPEYHRAKR